MLEEKAPKYLSWPSEYYESHLEMYVFLSVLSRVGYSQKNNSQIKKRTPAVSSVSL